MRIRHLPSYNNRLITSLFRVLELHLGLDVLFAIGLLALALVTGLGRGSVFQVGQNAAALCMW